MAMLCSSLREEKRRRTYYSITIHFVAASGLGLSVCPLLDATVHVHFPACFCNGCGQKTREH